MCIRDRFRRASDRRARALEPPQPPKQTTTNTTRRPASQSDKGESGTSRSGAYQRAPNRSNTDLSACYNRSCAPSRRFMRKLLLVLAGSALSVLTLAAAQTPAFFPINDVRPGMVGIGRTVFEGDKLEEFRANIVGVLRNVIGPGRDLILARLEGGPLANTGVIAGMSGSPVYIDGKLVGAVSYSIGSFPKEPLAGITPIAEMTGAVDAPSEVRPSGRGLAMRWPD